MAKDNDTYVEKIIRVDRDTIDKRKIVIDFFYLVILSITMKRRADYQITGNCM